MNAFCKTIVGAFALAASQTAPALTITSPAFDTFLGNGATVFGPTATFTAQTSGPIIPDSILTQDDLASWDFSTGGLSLSSLAGDILNAEFQFNSSSVLSSFSLQAFSLNAIKDYIFTSFPTGNDQDAEQTWEMFDSQGNSALVVDRGIRPVPEPGTSALIMAGLGAVVARRYFAQKKAALVPANG